MRRRLALVLTFAAIAACNRDLEVPAKPSLEKLGVVPAFASVAPREPLQLAAAGGAGPYSFAFAQGGQLSGVDATITPPACTPPAPTDRRRTSSRSPTRPARPPLRR